MRVIICGGRKWLNREYTWYALDCFHESYKITTVIHGAARGADSLAAEWADYRGIAAVAFPITRQEWNLHGRSAGHLRNTKMLAQGNPEHIIAFPGGAGTANMLDQAKRAGVLVWQPFPEMAQE